MLIERKLTWVRSVTPADGRYPGRRRYTSTCGRYVVTDMSATSRPAWIVYIDGVRNNHRTLDAAKGHAQHDSDAKGVSC